MQQQQVVKAQNVGYYVRSRTTDGAWWLVDADGCSCPAVTASCFHVRAVSALCAAEDAKYRRPVAPVHVAAMCD